jgi:hypothetical protein
MLNILLVLFFAVMINICAEDVYYEDFESPDVISQWTIEADSDIHTSLISGTNHVLESFGRSTATIALDTSSFSSVVISFQYGYVFLEGDDFCLWQVSIDGGASFSTIWRVRGDSYFNNVPNKNVYIVEYSDAKKATIESRNNPFIQLRMESMGNAHVCRLDDLHVTGIPFPTRQPTASPTNFILPTTVPSKQPTTLP